MDAFQVNDKEVLRVLIDRADLDGVGVDDLSIESWCGEETPEQVSDFLDDMAAAGAIGVPTVLGGPAVLVFNADAEGYIMSLRASDVLPGLPGDITVGLMWSEIDNVMERDSAGRVAAVGAKALRELLAACVDEANRLLPSLRVLAGEATAREAVAAIARVLDKPVWSGADDLQEIAEILHRHALQSSGAQ